MCKKVIIIGAGVIGLSAALESQKRGHDVIILEKGTAGGEASGAAAGMLAPFSEVEEDRDDFFKLCVESLRLFPKWQQEVKYVSNVDFEYTTCGTLHTLFHEADVLKMEMRASWHKEFGTDAIILSAEEVAKMEPTLSKDVVMGLYYPEESHLYAPDYIKSLKAACENVGVTIYEELGGTSISRWHTDQMVTTKDGRSFSGDELILCSGAWSAEWETDLKIEIPIYPIRGQICAYEKLESPFQHIVYTNQGYLVSKGNGTLICGASEDIAGFNTSVTERGINRLLSWNAEVAPILKNRKPSYTWAGLRPATQDGFPLIGKHSHQHNIILACGHYRNGILLSPITAQIVADLIDEKQSTIPLHSFLPGRFTYI